MILSFILRSLFDCQVQETNSNAEKFLYIFSLAQRVYVYFEVRYRLRRIRAAILNCFAIECVAHALSFSLCGKDKFVNQLLGGKRAGAHNTQFIKSDNSPNHINLC
jgi:hypothetical protein